jgi:MFS family permease
MSGAVVWTVGLALIRDTVGSEKLGLTIGNIFAFISVGELVAPILGGVMYDKFGNGAVFAMGFALLGVDFIMRFVMIEKKTAKKYNIDDGNSTTSTEQDEESGEDSPLLAKKYDDEEAWKIPKDQPWLIQKVPIIYTLRNPRLLTAQLVSGMQAVIISVFESTVPTESQDLFGFPSMKVGFLFIPLLLPYLLLGGLGGRAVDKYGGRIVSTIGYGYIAIPLVLLRIPHAGGTSEIIKFCVFLAMAGLGQALINSPGLVEASYVLERYHHANKELFGEDGPYAQLYALNSVMFSGGLTVGPLIAGALREKIGYGNMSAVVAGMCLVMSGLSWMFLGKIPKKS